MNPENYTSIEVPGGLEKTLEEMHGLRNGQITRATSPDPHEVRVWFTSVILALDNVKGVVSKELQENIDAFINNSGQNALGQNNVFEADKLMETVLEELEPMAGNASN